MAVALAAALLLGASRARASDPILQKSYSLEDALRLAAQRSATIQAAEQDIVIAEQRVLEARLRFLPEIGLQASATKYDARYPFALAPEFRSILLFPSSRPDIYSGRAYLTHTLYSGGRQTNLLRLAHSALKQAQSKHEAAKMDAAYEAKRVFYQLLLAQGRLEAAAARLSAASSVSTRAFSGWERVEAESLLSGLRSRQAQAEHAVELARLEFRQALSLELDTPVRLEGRLETRPVDMDIPRAVAWAMEKRPELQSETYKAQMDDIAVNLALGRRYPTLSVVADYEVTDQSYPLNQNNWDATVGVRIPFSFDYFSQVQQKRAEQDQGKVKRAELQDRVRLEVRRAYEETQFWQREWPLRERDFQRLQSLADAAEGDGRGLSRLRAEAALLDAQERYLASIVEHLLARARLERAVGRPVGP